MKFRALALAVALSAASVLPLSNSANAAWGWHGGWGGWHGGGWGWGGAGFGFAAGALLGSALAAPYYGYGYYAPTYYYPLPYYGYAAPYYGYATPYYGSGYRYGGYYRRWGYRPLYRAHYHVRHYRYWHR
jgi:hypothetical protein